MFHLIVQVIIRGYHISWLFRSNVLRVLDDILKNTEVG